MCIKILVSKKIKINKLSLKDIIPKIYKDIATDVIESGVITSCGLTQRIRSVLGGYSLSPDINNIAGSMGCLVKRNSTYYVLSSCHVLSCENTLKLGTYIIQPSYVDGGQVSSDLIRKLDKFIPIKFNTSTETFENYVDCGIGQITNKDLVSSKIAFIGNILGIDYPKMRGLVKKCGRTTEFTTGLIHGIGSTIKINFKTGSAFFKNQIITSKMSDNGDSGSILLDSNKNAIGLLMGSSTADSFFNSIHSILFELGISIVTNN